MAEQDVPQETQAEKLSWTKSFKSFTVDSKEFWSIVPSALALIYAAALTIGGIVFFIYYYNIKYYPDLDLTSAFSLLLGSAVAIIFIAILLVTLLILPGVIFRQESKDVTVAKKPYHAIVTFAIPLAIFLLLAAFSTSTFLTVDIPLYNDNNPLCRIFTSLLVAVVVGAFLTILVDSEGSTFASKHSSPQNQKRLKILLLVNDKQIISININVKALAIILWFRRKKFLEILRYCFWVTISLLFSSAAMAIIGIFPDQSLINIGLAAIFFISINVLVAYGSFVGTFSLFNRCLSIGALALFFIYNFVGLKTLPEGVMKTLKFGNFNANLLLDTAGCTLARMHKLQELGDCQFADVMVLSRLGSTYYLETKAADAGAVPVRFTIPAKEVLSWSVVETPPRQAK